MTNLINGKTLEEIKTALRVCPEDLCPLCPYEISYMCSDYMIRDALALIEHLEAKAPKWISVEERLPEKRGTYLCNYEFEDSGRIVMSCDYLGDKGWSFMTAHVTHWMPMLEQPIEKERDVGA